MVSAIYQHESGIGIHICPLLKRTLISLSILSQPLRWQNIRQKKILRGWQLGREKIRKWRRFGGVRKMGVRREQSHYVPASMDTRFLCEWSRAMMSAKRKGKAMNQKWNSISWYHSSAGYAGWQTEKKGT